MVRFTNNRVGREVRLLAEDGRDGPLEQVALAHQSPGKLHRAFSVVIRDRLGRILLQRRSMLKERWPGYIGNACCGHPESRESILVDARLRVEQELGIQLTDLVEIGTFVYRAEMSGSEWVEWEYDHVLLGEIDQSECDPDADEVSEVLWCTVEELESLSPLAPWLPAVMEVYDRHLREVT